MKLDRTSSIPLYAQIEEQIRKKILSGEWSSGALIESENELSTKYGVSRMTVRNVMTKLTMEGILFRIPGKGTFVSEEKIVARPLYYSGIRRQLEEQGYTISTKLIDISQHTVDTDVSNIFFDTDERTLFYVIKRLRCIKDKPLSFHISYIPVERTENLERFDLENDQLCDILVSNYGLICDRTTEILEAIQASKNQAALLEVSEGFPLLSLRDTLFDKEGIPFEHTRVIFRGEMIKIKLEF